MLGNPSQTGAEPGAARLNSLWDRMRDNFSIPNLDSPLVRR